MDPRITAALITSVTLIILSLLNKSDIGWKVYLTFRFPRNHKEAYYNKVLRKRLISLFKLLEKESEHALIVGIGPIINNFLWHKGFRGTLMTMAGFVERSAEARGENVVEARTLIEHLGWPLIEKKELRKGKGVLERGIELLKRNDRMSDEESLLYSKSLRHIAGYYLGEAEFEKGMQALDSALAVAGKIADAKLLNEAMAPIKYGQAVFTLKKEEHEANQAGYRLKDEHEANVEKAREFHKDAEEYYLAFDDKEEV